MDAAQLDRSPRPSRREVATRLGASLAALAAGASALVVVIGLLRQTPGPLATQAAAPNLFGGGATSAASAAAAPPPGFPAPPAGAVVYSREDGADAVALGVVDQGARTLVQVSVLNDQGAGARGLDVHVGAGAASARAVACGPGCYRLELPALVGRRVVAVELRGGGGAAMHWRVELPRVWPAPLAGVLMTDAGRVWRALHSLAYVDRLASGPGQEVTSTWQIVAPDRVAYQVVHGSQAIIVGGRRWDREKPHDRWIASPQDPALTQPLPFWVGVRDAHLLGSGRIGGRAVWLVSFFDPVTPAWFEVALEKSTLRTLDMHMVTTAHFMHDSYVAFNRPLAITPPAGAA